MLHENKTTDDGLECLYQAAYTDHIPWAKPSQHDQDFHFQIRNRTIVSLQTQSIPESLHSFLQAFVLSHLLYPHPGSFLLTIGPTISELPKEALPEFWKESQTHAACSYCKANVDTFWGCRQVAILCILLGAFLFIFHSDQWNGPEWNTRPLDQIWGGSAGLCPWFVASIRTSYLLRVSSHFLWGEDCRDPRGLSNGQVTLDEQSPLSPKCLVVPIWYGSM